MGSGIQGPESHQQVKRLHLTPEAVELSCREVRTVVDMARLGFWPKELGDSAGVPAVTGKDWGGDRPAPRVGCVGGAGAGWALHPGRPRWHLAKLPGGIGALTGAGLSGRKSRWKSRVQVEIWGPGPWTPPRQASGDVGG